ncbi:MAG TPA: type VI secretion system protein TssA [Micropepsaceae bacterium]|nr:type VI secretion system protein TssA [Micropepsaceae bacterium]
MGSPQCIDIEKLLAPISDGAPAGSNIREDVSPASLYFRLKDARSAARVAEKRADAEGESQGVTPEWRTIQELATKVLSEQSKDLEVAAWLIEALVRLQGFPGLRDGFQLARGLVEQYWDTLHSLEDEEGVATKVAPLTGLNGADGSGTLLQPIRKIALTKAVGEGPFAAYHYEQGWSLSEISDPEVRARREQSGVVTLDRFMAVANASGGAFYVTLLEDIQASIDEWGKLGAALDERAGDASPPTSAIREILSTILEMVQRFSKDLVARVTQIAQRPSGDVVPANGSGSDEGAAGHGFNGGIRSREDALRVLLLVAEYFRANEPHSPTAISLEETVRRARLSFSDLLMELLPDRTAWRSALTSAGIKPPPENS